MLKFKIKQDENVNKMELNKRFSKNIEIAEDLDEIITPYKVTVLLWYLEQYFRHLQLGGKIKILLILRENWLTGRRRRF